MLNTIKSKIIFISVIMLAALNLLLCLFGYLYLKNGKTLLLDSYSHSISVFAKNINKEVIKIENNAKDLALHGELFFAIDKDKSIAEQTIIKLFDNYQDSLGGGIWFEPYSVRAYQKLLCIYVYRNKDNKVVTDEEFETEAYNYPNQSWYKEIMPQLAGGDRVAWSLPYFEKEGSNTLMVTAGAGIYNNNKLVGMSTVDWEISSIIKSVSEIKPTPNTFALFADKKHDYIIAVNDSYMNNDALIGKPLKSLPWYNDNLKQITYFDYHNKKYVPYVKTLDNEMILIVNIPKHEMYSVLYRNVLILLVGLLMVTLFISLLLYMVLKRNINTPIEKLSDIANRISQGDLEAEIKIEKPKEFAKLADTFHKMTTDIKSITKERERIESELTLAKAIQASSLPNVFPPYPDNNEFDIFADMEPAKEVGGDFYDFYFIDETHFMFLIADVSGKGIPAALFMMTVKTLINYIAQSGYSPKQMIEKINKKIYKNNKQGFFVTMLAGIVDVKTGDIAYVNCGHNPPLVKHGKDPFKFVDLKPNIVLGAFESADFNINTAKLSPGDTVILYTDGITEAVDSAGELYGEERLLTAINNQNYLNTKDMLQYIKQDTYKFTKEMPQSDDMTMLIFKYNGEPKEGESILYSENATKENYKHYLNWLTEVVNKFNLEQDLMFKLQLVSEEIYTNVFSYAYPEEEGNIQIIFTKYPDEIMLQISDSGVPFNPLDREDPDVELPPQSREQGGLGIYMVKKTADGINYEYKDGKNILTLQFRLN